MAQNVRINSIHSLLTGEPKAPKQDGAVEVEEPLEKRSEALEEENPKVIAEILVKIRHPGAEIYY